MRQPNCRRHPTVSRSLLHCQVFVLPSALFIIKIDFYSSSSQERNHWNMKDLFSNASSVFDFDSITFDLRNDSRKVIFKIFRVRESSHLIQFRKDSHPHTIEMTLTNPSSEAFPLKAIQLIVSILCFRSRIVVNTAFEVIYWLTSFTDDSPPTLSDLKSVLCSDDMQM